MAASFFFHSVARDLDVMPSCTEGRSACAVGVVDSRIGRCWHGEQPGRRGSTDGPRGGHGAGVLLDVPQHTVLGVDTRCSRSAPGSEGSRWCPQARVSSTTAPPAGTGMSLHLLLDSSLLPTRLRWLSEDGMLKRRDY
ncbi:uncharacterized protein [Aegilops tauschii subsp. strangulata]|uniref:uncharacterized protein isoform X2 n=1 Tax=Aegilops tauschii subsp. strangulata TaxID=200361 RepID=UPI00098A2DCC|nr:uncharacterized protein LOC109755406 isoform X2 [Aegilops tauschii subsp. strangulata]